MATNSKVNDNIALLQGGGIGGLAGSSITLRDVTVNGNNATGNGGGLWIAGTLIADNTLIENNDTSGDGSKLSLATTVAVTSTYL